ncbi:MAG: hypothetical protein GY786_10865, partial [Proteobacteria bacterium]|nr:hypothetical protein [Pseudomonadota bacterium]
MDFRAFINRPFSRKSSANDSNNIPVWIFSVIAGVLITVLHLMIIPVTPGLDITFPSEGEISDKEYRAPFDFSVSLPQQDIELRQFQRVLVEPPVVDNNQIEV